MCGCAECGYVLSACVFVYVYVCVCVRVVYVPRLGPALPYYVLRDTRMCVSKTLSMSTNPFTDRRTKNKTEAYGGM
jgi:hypothetical protein